MTAPYLFCFGFGYTARVLARRLAAEDWIVGGTSRTEGKASGSGFPAEVFDRDHPLPQEALDGVTHLLVSVPPDAAGDPVLAVHGEDVAQIKGLRWLGYLSTTGVYGDRGGGWVDETAALSPSGKRGRRRVAAEAGWLDLWHRRAVPVHIFRLAGIYGPGRSPFEALRAGTAKRIDKPGQVFSRIHVEDLACVLANSISRPRPGGVYNVCDDDPAAPEAVVAHAAALLGAPAPPLVPFEAAELSPIARSFYDDNKRVSNRLIKNELGVTLRHPDFRSGLAAILADEACPKTRHPASSD
ncbi:MAG TPA: SDR family oxidoreductase [Stellaceae bacterium]|jgi:nucleoside-diphosphate-sugar epimerase|nr:SDR family oxidoreductase [Stellaceae bacterium]